MGVYVEHVVPRIINAACGLKSRTVAPTGRGGAPR